MKNKNSTRIPRRQFLQNSALGLGMGYFGAASTHSALAANKTNTPASTRLPREVWVATFCLSDFSAKNYREMIQIVFNRLEEVAVFKPDIICLPEAFPFSYLTEDSPPPTEVAEEPLGEISGQCAEFAKRHRCYLICPIYTRAGDSCYNAAVVIDRAGKLMGEYRKIHPTEGEIEDGIRPGPLNPPVFKTDFGVIGVQICFDIQWSDGWKKLSAAGAEIVFWPSAFGGGRLVNTKAWQNKYCVVSSTWKGTTKICDVTGEEIARTGHWNPHWVCAPINLEKAVLHTWPYVKRFKEIEAKYGRKIRIQNWHEEEWTVIESLSPEVKVATILQEFNLKTHHEHIQSATRRQDESR